MLIDASVLGSQALFISMITLKDVILVRDGGGRVQESVCDVLFTIAF
jgi:hypothetical protein